MTILPSRIANEKVQSALIELMLWVHPYHTDCPGCGTSVAARDYTTDDPREDWWRFVFAVRRWLEHPGTTHLCDDHLQWPVTLPSRVADHATQQSIIDMVSWSVATAQLQCYCGHVSLGPDEDAQKDIATIIAWLQISQAQLDALAQRWSFKNDDPAKELQVRNRPGAKKNETDAAQVFRRDKLLGDFVKEPTAEQWAAAVRNDGFNHEVVCRGDDKFELFPRNEVHKVVEPGEEYSAEIVQKMEDLGR